MLPIFPGQPCITEEYEGLSKTIYTNSLIYISFVKQGFHRHPAETKVSFKRTYKVVVLRYGKTGKARLSSVLLPSLCTNTLKVPKKEQERALEILDKRSKIISLAPENIMTASDLHFIAWFSAKRGFILNVTRPPFIQKTKDLFKPSSIKDIIDFESACFEEQINIPRLDKEHNINTEQRTACIKALTEATILNGQFVNNYTRYLIDKRAECVAYMKKILLKYDLKKTSESIT